MPNGKYNRLEKHGHPAVPGQRPELPLQVTTKSHLLAETGADRHKGPQYRITDIYISDGTVKSHLTEILDKLQARDRTHAVLKAIAQRFL
jgi:hypothetical protein